MAGKQSTRSTRSIWEDQSTEYNQNAPSILKAVRGEKWKRRALVVVAFGVLPLCLLITMGTISGNANAKQNVNLTDASPLTNSSPGKAAAYSAVLSWLNSDPSPLPGGKVVSWNGYTVQSPPPAKQDSGVSEPTYRFETHSFTLSLGDQMFNATVQVAVDKSGASAQATSTPDLTPVVNGQVSGTITTWFGYDSATPSSAVSDAVTAWADAFTSGDPDALRRAVQDKSSTRSYVPLSGVSSVVNVQLPAAADVPTGNDNVKPTKMIVRVQMSVWWTGHAPANTASGKDSQTPQPLTYDVLVEDANTAAPYVVAWGGAGSGPTLKAYQNALNGVSLNLATPAPAATTTGGN